MPPEQSVNDPLNFHRIGQTKAGFLTTGLFTSTVIFTQCSKIRKDKNLNPACRCNLSIHYFVCPILSLNFQWSAAVLIRARQSILGKRRESPYSGCGGRQHTDHGQQRKPLLPSSLSLCCPAERLNTPHTLTPSENGLSVSSFQRKNGQMLQTASRPQSPNCPYRLQWVILQNQNK